jgi:hypothetical protein
MLNRKDISVYSAGNEHYVRIVPLETANFPNGILLAKTFGNKKSAKEFADDVYEYLLNAQGFKPASGSRVIKCSLNDGEEISEERFYMAGSYKVKCPKCGNIDEDDFCDNYLSYPIVGKKTFCV